MASVRVVLDGVDSVFNQGELGDDIERLRRRLVETAGAQQDLLRNDVLQLSLQLDRLVVAYLRETHPLDRSDAAD